MSGKPIHTEPVTVVVRSSSYTYMARAVGMGITASCTGSPRMAAHRVASKVFGGPDRWELVGGECMRFVYAPRTGE